MDASVLMLFVVSVPVRMCRRGLLSLCWSARCMSFFADVHFSQSQVAKEGHKPQPEHIEGSKQGGDDSNQPQYWIVQVSAPEDFVLAEEAAQGREAGNRKCCRGHHPESYRNQFA